MECLGAVGVAVVVWYGGQQVIAGVDHTGHVLSLTAIFMLYEPMRKLSRVNNTIQSALAAAERTFAVLDTPDEWVGDARKPVLPPMRHRLIFTRCSLRYRADGPLVCDINLTVEAGEVVALVGASGAAGKTSLVHLVPRFYAPTSGCITIDGVDIGSVSLASLRAHIGIVSQDVVLFDDTLWQNIRYGNLHASDTQVQAAARAAYAHDFVMQLSQGYDTVIGGNGVRLSGGEKQRIAIARALLRNAHSGSGPPPPDTAEVQVQYALANYERSHHVCHCASAVDRCQQNCRAARRHFVEIGPHAELLAKDGYYSQLYKLQFKSQE